MSDVEYECRETIWRAYLRWAVQSTQPRLNWLAYGRALGLEVP
jgi:hypothetical protein